MPEAHQRASRFIRSQHAYDELNIVGAVVDLQQFVSFLESPYCLKLHNCCIRNVCEVRE